MVNYKKPSLYICLQIFNNNGNNTNQTKKCRYTLEAYLNITHNAHLNVNEYFKK